MTVAATGTDGKVTSTLDQFKISGDDAGAKTDLTNGNAQGAAGAPAGGQSDTTKKSDAAAGTAGSSDKTGQIPDRKTLAEDILKNLQTQNLTPDEELAQVKDELARSSKGSRFNNDAIKAMRELLSAQGIEVAIEKGKNERNEEIPLVSVVPGKGYTPKMDGKFHIDVKDLPEEVREGAGENLQKFTDHVVALASKALVRVLPTAERPVNPVSEERLTSVLDHLEKTSRPELKDNRSVVMALIAEKSKSREFQALLSADTNFVSRILADAVEMETLRAIDRAKKIEETRLKNEEEARKKAGLLPSGQSDNHLGAGGDAGKSGSRLAEFAM